ncbi:MAG: NAD(P)H-hydrate dehydratase [Alphaproteobacteria bacterium]|nr:NAD(P)H-hydrate dehydratase [Alphaproteobacteria bacterium]
MRPVYDVAAVRAADRAVIDGLGLPGIALMETASRGVAMALVERWPDAAARGIVVLCGPGQNGGDGYGLARWLATWGLPVVVVSTSDTSPGDAGIQRRAALRAGVTELATVTDLDVGVGAIAVDALFGTGLHRPLTGAYADLVRWLVQHPGPRVAVDVPSGLDADTGVVLGGEDALCAPADLTVTFGGARPGMYTGQGPALCGAIVVVDIGLDPRRRTAEVPDAADLAPCWPRRAAGDHKHRSGHLLVLAGSTAMAGAAVLACRGALAAGAGLVTLAVAEGVLPRLGALPPEVMVRVVGPGDRYDGAPLALDGATAVAFGPGLGGGGPLAQHVVDTLQGLWHEAGLPMVADADGLVAAHGAGAAPRVITPHPGEAARWLDRATVEVQADRFGAVRSLADRGDVALLKGPRTLVARAGVPVSINPTGDAVLATAGSGDVLTGVIGALLARGVSAWDAARLGAWVHGQAGERLAARRSQGWTASDVAAAVPDAVETLLDSSGA